MVTNIKLKEDINRYYLEEMDKIYKSKKNIKKKSRNGNDGFWKVTPH